MPPRRSLHQHPIAVHPVLRRLPQREQIVAEKGLLHTFGRIMPVGMTASPVLAGSYAATQSGTLAVLAWLSCGALVVALACTIGANVGINLTTGRWDPDAPPANWRETRRRWDAFQAARSWLLLGGFVLLAACEAAG